MKQLWFLFLMGVMMLCSVSWAGYTPDTETNTQLTRMKDTLSRVSPADLWDYTQQLATLSTLARGQEEKWDYLLSHLHNYASNQFASQKTLAKQEAKSGKQAFLSEHQAQLLLQKELPSSCLGWYNLLDNLSFAYNFPTALTIAVRYRETSCGYILPKNWDGPFQILSKEYGTGEITEELFVKTVKDFLDFSQHKIKRYNKANQKSGLQISLSYTGASLEDLLKFSALYNGLSGASVYGEIRPAAPKYFWEGYRNEAWTGTSQREGILSLYLKVAQRELNH